MKFILTIWFCFVTALFTKTFAQSGKLDYSFSDNGLVLTKASGIAKATGLAEQSDGKIVVVGTLTTLTDTRAMFVRYNVNGTIDSTFGINGIDTFFLGPGIHGYIGGLVIQPDDKILIAGSASLYDENKTGTIIYRLTKNGLLDSSFNKNGIFFSYTIDDTNAATLQPDGKILISCEASPTKVHNDIAIARLNSDGSFDTSFNHTGVSISPTIYQSIPYNLKLQADGKIVTCGIYNIDSTLLHAPVWTGAIVRFNSNGTIDSTFGVNGIVHWPYKFIGDHAYFMNADQQQNGKLLICGFDTSTSFVLRFNNNGQVDSSFGDNGLAYTKPYSGGLAIAVQTDDRIDIGGSINLSSIDFAINQFTPNGALDSSFGKNKNGTAAASFGIHPSYALALCFSNTRIYLAGTSDSAFAVAAFLRYNTVLPVKLLSFTAQRQKSAVVLQWQTTNEVNNDYFSVERSPDSKLFTGISNKLATNNALKSNYSFVDETPFSGINYYRLKQVDKDGKFTYSNVVSIDFSSNASTFAVYPNPASSIIKITLLSINTKSDITLFDVIGKKVLHERLASNINSKQINISKLPAGVYNVVLIQDGKRQAVKVVKK